MLYTTTLITCALVAQQALAAPQDGPLCSLSEWKLFKEKFNKKYGDNLQEDRTRLAIFCKNLQKITEHNSNPNVTYTQGLNHFSDMLPDESDGYVHGLRTDDHKLIGSNTPHTEFPVSFISDKISKKIVGDINRDPPKEVDWSSDPKRVSPARDQGNCGSCWAFATIALLEGQEKPVGNDKLVELSEQNLVDCDKANMGCDGGFFDTALGEIRRLGGVMTRADYPYVSGNTSQVGPCNMVKEKAYKTTINLGKTVQLPMGNETFLKQIVASYGPVGVAITALEDLKHYAGGIYYNPTNECKDFINHGVTIVGYGHSESIGMDYWIIKNSWSRNWGIDGFARMARNKNNNCNIASVPFISLPYE